MNQQKFNILLLGKSGVGKTKFALTLDWYLHYDDFQEAFNRFRKDHLNRKAYTKPLQLLQEPLASTIDVEEHLIENKEVALRLIDTPGFSNNSNIDRILKYLCDKKIENLNAICLFMTSTITDDNDYLKQILSKIDKSASKNLIFVFMNDYTPGKALFYLKKRIDKLNLDITINDEKIFCLDNESVKLLAEKKNNLDNETAEKIMYSWETSKSTCTRLISYISQLPYCEIYKTTNANSALKLIEDQISVLVDVSQLMEKNYWLLETSEEDMEKQRQDLFNIREKLFKIQKKSSKKVCTSKKCASTISIDGKNKRFYIQICDNSSKWNFLKSIFKEKSSKCEICKCHNMSHQTIEKLYKINEDYEITQDRVKLEISIKTKEIRDRSKAIENIQWIESEEILNNLAKFLYVFKHSFIFSDHDRFINHINDLISSQDTQILKQFLEKCKTISSFSNNEPNLLDLNIKNVDEFIQQVQSWKNNCTKITDLLNNQKLDICKYTKDKVTQPPANSLPPIFDKADGLTKKQINGHPENLEVTPPDKDQFINIILMGETGVGKSTFINAMANYCRFDNFESAFKEKPIILIPTQFSITDMNEKEHTLACGEDTNEVLEVGKAGTQHVKTYNFPIGKTKNTLRLIDTPGMGDPRGAHKDEENCENILQYIAGLDKLHAICFLMKPTTTRQNVLFIHCVKQILSRLDKSASKNIIFVFTNTRASDYSPGETKPILRKLINDINANAQTTIALKTNVFSMDNEAFKTILALHKGLKLADRIIKCSAESWEVSSKEAWRLFSYITGNEITQGLEPHDVKNTISINEIRNTIEQLGLPLSDITQLIQRNLRVLDEQQHKLNTVNQSLEELKSKLFVPVIDLQVYELAQPVTVCAGRNCLKAIEVGNTFQPIYTQRCHSPCTLTTIKKNLIGDSGLMNCLVMDRNKNCRNCGCHYSVHMHIYYESMPKYTEIEDNNIKTNIATKEEALKRAQSVVKEIERKKMQLEMEHQIIVEAMAKFAFFLQNNAITPFNDSYKEYIEYLIDREKQLEEKADLNIMKHLQESLRKHEELKETFKKNLKASASLQAFEFNPDSMKKEIDKLYQLQHHGKKIKEMMDKQNVARSKEFSYAFESITVDADLYKLRKT